MEDLIFHKIDTIIHNRDSYKVCSICGNINLNEQKECFICSSTNFNEITNDELDYLFELKEGLTEELTVGINLTNNKEV